MPASQQQKELPKPNPWLLPIYPEAYFLPKERRDWKEKHLEDEAKRLQVLHEEEVWPRGLPQAVAAQPEIYLPDLAPLTSGAVQPSDFVKQWVETARDDSPEVLPPWSNSHRRLVEQDNLLLKRIRQRHYFELAIIGNNRLLDARVKAIAVRHFTRASYLFLSNVLIIAILLVQRSRAEPLSLLASLDVLGFASLLLVAPVLGLFAYSRLMFINHSRRQDVQIQRTKLAAATHAYETYEEIQRIQERIKRQAREQSDLRQEILQQELHFERKRAEQALDLDYKRAENAATMESKLRRQRLENIHEFLDSVQPDVYHGSERIVLKLLDIWVGSTDSDAGELGPEEG